ncbi:MAG: hypothetical protein LIO65_08650 [Odoribacter sp.]|nr:hypothetical protein [Odoribacter sp.]
MKNIFIAFSLFILVFYSCGNTNKELPSYTIIKKDFESSVLIDGFVEPVDYLTLNCPQNISGNIAFLVEDGTYVEKGEVVCIIEDQGLQNRYDRALLDLENAEATLIKTQVQLDLDYTILDAQVKNNEAETKIAELDSLQLLYAPPVQQKIKELELEQVKVQRRKYDEKLKALAVVNQTEMKRREMEVNRLTEYVKQLEEEVESLVIKAPKKGLTIRGTNPRNRRQLEIGDRVWNGMGLVIIPEMEEMKVRILASERDFKYINVDDSVIYTFDALPGNMGFGKIIKKGTVGQENNDSKVKYFEIEASVDSTTILPEPGFTARCQILLQQVKDTLVIPQISVFREDSIKVVYVQKEKGYEMREVETGLTSSKEAIVSSGLNYMETVSLTKPPASAIKSRTFLDNKIHEYSPK